MSTWSELTDVQKRKLLFTPCTSKDGLHRWIKRFLALDIPDGRVDPTSNSSPMELIWEVYERCQVNAPDTWSRLLAYAAREAFKTLAAAVLEVLAIVHMGRSIAHMAAIKAQSLKAQSYVGDFFNMPLLREYVTLDNDSNKEFVRYFDKLTGESLTPKEYERVAKTSSSAQLERYKQIKHGIVIVVATLQSTNSQHTPFVVLDEVDVMVNPKVYEESKAIASPFEGKLPVTFLTSTRKFRFGLVQKEIDRASKSGMQVRHWNIIDVTERCPADRHLPHLPIIDVYYSEETLETVSSETYETFSSERKEKFNHDQASPGCLSRCKMFAMCRGRLKDQKASDPNARVKSMLKPIHHVQEQFSNFDLDMAKAQLLCWKPSSTGIVYPYFDPEVHFVTATQIAEMITGQGQPQGMDKAQLLMLLKTRTNVRFRAGMDFGYTHRWAVTVAALDGPRCFVLDCISVAEMETEQQIELAQQRIGHYPGLKIHADPEDPQSIRSFRKKGFRIAPVKKGPGSVVGGIQVVRQMLRPAKGRPQLFFLSEDPDKGMPILQNSLSIYHWKTDAAGNPTDQPAEEGANENDALRYLIRGSFGKGGKVTASKDEQRPQSVQQPIPVPMPGQAPSRQNWMGETIRNLTGGTAAHRVESGEGGRRSGIFFSID